MTTSAAGDKPFNKTNYKLLLLGLFLMIALTSLSACTVTESPDPNPVPINYQLSVSLSGSGSGHVSAQGIDCGSDCSESFRAATNVQLEATARAGSTFKSWQGACTGSNPICEVTMNHSQQVTAVFELAEVSYHLNLNFYSLGGQVSAEGLDCLSTCEASFAAGTVLNLAAVPDAHHDFRGFRRLPKPRG
ncbi:MAG: hypothetical protein R2880_02050 [Deinococcales bacterium]